jgi:hypothetical protein
MGKIRYNNEYGWFGNCDFNECTDLYLTLSTERENIDSIIRTKINGDATGYEKFTCYDGDSAFPWNNLIADTQTIDDYFNYEFDKLECGRAYLVNTNVNRNKLSEYEIPGFNTPTGKSFVSSNCSDVLEVPCSEDDYEEINIVEKEFKMQNDISIQMGDFFPGSFNIPKRKENSGYLPYIVNVRIKTSEGNKNFATITYNGSPDASLTMYFSQTAGGCYKGTILNQDGVRTCILDVQ